MAGTRGWGTGRQLGFHGDGISVGDDEKPLETMVVMVAQGYERTTCYRAMHLREVKMVKFM